MLKKIRKANRDTHALRAVFIIIKLLASLISVVVKAVFTVNKLTREIFIFLLTFSLAKSMVIYVVEDFTEWTAMLGISFMIFNLLIAFIYWQVFWDRLNKRLVVVEIWLFVVLSLFILIYGYQFYNCLKDR